MKMEFWQTDYIHLRIYELYFYNYKVGLNGSSFIYKKEANCELKTKIRICSVTIFSSNDFEQP